MSIVMNVSVLTLLGWAWAFAALIMVGAWLVQRGNQNAAVVDVAWCLAFSFVAIGYAFVASGEPARRLLVAGMAVTWGFRLAGYILLNRILGKPEDTRYQTLRKRFGKWAQLSWFLLYQVEALALAVFSLPLLVLMENGDPTLRWWEGAGVGVWLIAIIGEWIADRQLARFRADPENHGKTLQGGLWRYSRHPNYFFESLHWWAYVVMAVGAPFGWVTLVGPVMMTIALVKVSGIPLAESQALASRGEEYRQYQRRTSAFIPWFPKKVERLASHAVSQTPVTLNKEESP